MNPLEIARDIISIGTTAGIKKDLLDSQAAKIRILTDEIVGLRTKVSQLEIENHQLRALLKNPTPVIKLDDTSRKALQHFCDRNNVVTIRELAGFLSCPESKAQFVCDGLTARGFVGVAFFSDTDPRLEPFGNNSGFEITADGRKFCFENAG